MQDPARRLTLSDGADRVIGIHVRRLAYAELLPRFSELAKPALFGKASSAHRLVGDALWPLSRRIMIRMHGITPDAAAESRSILESELDWLDHTLADNRRYLAGDRFSRADITVASLLAFFARPREMPIYHEMTFPGALLADLERWPRSAGNALGRRAISDASRIEARRGMKKSCERHTRRFP